MRRRAQIIKLPNGNWGVDLPTYSMIAGTHRPIVSKLIDADGVHPDFTEADFARLVPTVEIEIPDDWPLDDAGQLDADKLRAMYCEHPRFGAEDYTPPVLESP